MSTGTTLRELRLKALKMAMEIKRAEQDNKVLKTEIRQGNDVLRRERHMQDLKEELAQLRANERKLAIQCCFGEPDWSGQGDMWGDMQEGTEILHEAVKKYPALIALSAGAHHVVDFAYSSRPTQLQIYKKPFAMGGMRMAFYARNAAGQKLVAKRALEEHRKLKINIIGAHVDAEAAALSQLIAHDFTRELHKMVVTVAEARTSVEYLPATVALLPDPENPGKITLVKPIYTWLSQAPLYSKFIFLNLILLAVL